SATHHPPKLTQSTRSWAKSSTRISPKSTSTALRSNTCSCAKGPSIMLSFRQRAALLSLLMLALFLGAWELATYTPQGSGPESEYAALVAGADETAGVPPPSKVLALAYQQLRDPFYDRGPNDKGIGIQLGYSLVRVL